MQNSSLQNESTSTCDDFLHQQPDIRERLINFAKLRSQREISREKAMQPGNPLQTDDAMIPYAYKLGSCDIFPLWYVSAAISYMKETGDYGIIDEIRLQDVFNIFCGLSGEFAGIMGIFAETGHLSMEDTVTVGLFQCVCREYLGMCKFLGTYKEAAFAEVRLKWISDMNPELSDKFGKAEWLPQINDLLIRKTGRRIRGFHSYCDEIGQFIRSGIFELMSVYNRKNAHDFWLTTSSVWSREATAEVVFGIKPGFQGLFVNPCIPDSFDDVEVKRTYRNAVYDISVRNPRHRASDIRRLVVDNSEYLGNLVPNFADGKTHRIEVTMDSFD